MSRLKKLLLGMALSLCGGALFAQSLETAPPYPSELPQLGQALDAIRQAPQVQAAMAMIDAEAANRDRLEAGPYEWAMRIEGQRRNINGEQGTPNQR